MKAIQKILFPTDFSETAQNAFRYCLRVADEYEAEIELLHVIYPEYQPMDIPIMAAKAMQDQSETAKVVLQEFVDMCITQVQAEYQLKKAPQIHSEVMVGNPSSMINEIANRDNVDVIIMGTRQKHNAFDKTFGSVTTGVIGHADCSVWVIPGEAKFKDIDIIAYATDLNEADPYHIWKATMLLDTFHPILHCVHVGNGEDKALKMSDLELFFAQQTPALQINFHTIKGNSVLDKLAEFTETYDVNVLIMYAPHHNFWERIFLQSTTRNMALRSKIPVLFYKSEE